VSVVSAEDLGRLARKYETLAELRRARERGEPVPEAAVFKALAREFPGCLAELDTLPLAVIDARAAALAQAAAGAGAEPWMVWLAGYHAWMRAALWLKPRLARGAEGGADLAEGAAAHAGVAVDEAFVRAVARPPKGRIVATVLARLAAIHGVPAPDLKRAIFPAARR
jgi:hypothetical protein